MYFLYFQLAMPGNENATPIRILHNAAGHLAGPARSLGAVLMGYLGKCFSFFVFVDFIMNDPG